MGELPTRGAPSSIYERVGFDQILLPGISVPLEQEIMFQTPPQTIGGQPLLITATALMALLARLRASARPSPDHFEPDRFTETNSRDCILLAAMFHRLVAARLGGFTLTGLRFIFRLAKICGLRIENYPFRSRGVCRVRITSRKFLARGEVLTDIRKFPRPIDSSANFTGQVTVVFHGSGLPELPPTGRPLDDGGCVPPVKEGHLPGKNFIFSSASGLGWFFG